MKLGRPPASIMLDTFGWKKISFEEFRGVPALHFRGIGQRWAERTSSPIASSVLSSGIEIARETLGAGRKRFSRRRTRGGQAAMRIFIRKTSDRKFAYGDLCPLDILCGKRCKSKVWSMVGAAGMADDRGELEPDS